MPILRQEFWLNLREARRLKSCRFCRKPIPAICLKNVDKLVQRGGQEYAHEGCYNKVVEILREKQ